MLAWLLVACLAVPLRAQSVGTAFPDVQAALSPKLLAVRVALSDRRVRAASQNASRRLEKWLGLLTEVEGRPELGPSDLQIEIAEGLSRRRYKALILGESHSVPQERAFARGLLDMLMGRGLLPGAFIREQHTYDDASALEARQVPVLDFGNQFQPAPEIDAALRRFHDPLVTYSGHAHSCDRVKDYVQNELDSGRAFGFGRGLKDMPTIEQAFASRGRKPAIVAMIAEAGMFDRIQYLFLKQATAETAELAPLRQGLQDAVGAWVSRLSQSPAAASGIHFVRHPKQDNLVLGITRGERRPLALESALAVLQLPEAEAWLAGGAITGLESLRHSSGDANGMASVVYKVNIHKAGGETFTRDIPISRD